VSEIKDYSITDFGTWLHDFGSSMILRMWHKNNLESDCQHIRIKTAMEIPNDILLEIGFLNSDGDGTSAETYTEFVRLSEVKFAWCKSDQI